MDSFSSPDGHPHLRIVGPFPEGLDTEAFSDYLANIRSQQLPGEIDKPPEILDAIDYCQRAILAFGQDLGIDLKSRMPKASEIHIFDDYDKFCAAAKDRAPDKPGTPTPLFAAKADVGYGVLVYAEESFRQRDADALLYNLTHEFLHFVSSVDYTGESEGDNHYHLVRQALGYGVVPAYMWPISEKFTDIAALHVANRYIGAITRAGSYTDLDVAGDYLIRKTAEQNGIDPQDLIESTWQDMLTGHSNGLRLIDSTLGSQVFRELARYGDEERKSILIDLLSSLGMTDVQGTIDCAIADNSFSRNLLHWLVRRRAPNAPLRIPLSRQPVSSSESDSAHSSEPLPPLASSIGQVAAALETAKNQHIPTTLSGIMDRMAAIDERIAQLRASIDEQNKHRVESQLDLLQNAQTMLGSAAATLNEGDVSVVRRISEYLKIAFGN
ncbi:MAG TPA: hypothetical protein VMR45_04420 [Patescibacteria group bacterium]|nr:hypothetical protein [Patescibacteria group bacterium]